MKYETCPTKFKSCSTILKIRLAIALSRKKYLFTSLPFILILSFQQTELDSKTERVAILEEALQETVNSVSENERLLHEQTNKNYELEVELANMKIENTVTNTKNASLILSLSERDIALSFYRNERKRMMAEVLEMK